jgi:hypothetical protein
VSYWVIENPVFSPQNPVFCSPKTDWVCWSGCKEIPVTYWVGSSHVTTRIPQTYWGCFGTEDFTGYLLGTLTKPGGKACPDLLQNQELPAGTNFNPDFHAPLVSPS